MITGQDVTVVIASVPQRAVWLDQAARSVHKQSVQPASTIVQVDDTGAGAAATRNAALEAVQTDWVAFLDDDDWFHFDHLETLIDGANKSGADLIGTWPAPYPRDRADNLICCLDGVPYKGPVHVPWGPDQMDHLDARQGWLCPHCNCERGSFIMVTNLVRMELVRKVGGFPERGSMGDDFAGWDAEDYLFLLALLDAGAKFHHVTGVRTWTYRVKE